MTTHQQDLVSWLAFPEVPQWSSFAPQLIFRLRRARSSMRPDEAIRLFETDSLVHAVGILEERGTWGVEYLAVPTGGQRGRKVSYQLSIDIADPYRAKPVAIAEPSDSVLWCPAQQGHAYFALEKAMPQGSVELVVGGDSADECHEIWAIVSQWIRRLYLLRFPRKRWMGLIEFPLKTRAQMQRERRAFNERLCEVVKTAEKAERRRRTFTITGRGHEPRVSLSRSVATALRGVDLHRYTTSGYCSQSFYPTRVFVRAAKMLEAEFGRPMLSVSGATGRYGKVYFASVASSAT